MDQDTSSSTCTEALEKCFACAACCDAAQARAAHSETATATDGYVDYECVTSADGFGRTCGFSGYSTCACKAATRSGATSLCGGEAWAADVIAQCHGIGAARDDAFL